MESNGGSEVVTKSVSGGRVGFLIVEALAEATDQRPVDVPPLYESVDLDALAALVIHRDEDVHVEFEHVGYTVTVADGTVTVESQ